MRQTTGRGRSSGGPRATGWNGITGGSSLSTACSRSTTRCCRAGARVAARGQAARAHHRDRGPGWLAARRASARAAVRGLRGRSACALRALRESGRHSRANRADPGRPARRALAGRRAQGLRAAGGLQPRLGVVRADVVEATRSDGRVRGGGGHDDAGVDPGRRRRHPLLPSLLERDLRRAGRGAADGADAAGAADAVRGGEGVRPLHHSQLPAPLRAPRVVGDPLQPRVAAPAARLRHAEGRPRRGRHQARARRASSGSATSTRAGTGATPATTCARCG